MSAKEALNTKAGNKRSIFASRNPHATSCDRVLLDIQVKTLLHSHPKKEVLFSYQLSSYQLIIRQVFVILLSISLVCLVFAKPPVHLSLK